MTEQKTELTTLAKEAITEHFLGDKMTEQKTEVEILREAINEAIFFLDAPEIPHNEVDMSMSIALKQALAEAEKVAVSNFKPTWNLTQILIQLEESGLSEFNALANGGHSIISWCSNEFAELIFLDERIIVRSEDEKLDYKTLPEAIEKLKELLKDN